MGNRHQGFLSPVKGQQRLDAPPRASRRDPLNIMRGRPDSRSDSLEVLGYLNPVALIAAIGVGIASLVRRIAHGRR